MTPRATAGDYVYLVSRCLHCETEIMTVDVGLPAADRLWTHLRNPSTIECRPRDLSNLAEDRARMAQYRAAVLREQAPPTSPAQ